jgi:hypothetical protein
VVIGGGTITTENFNGINWANGGKFLQVELDVAGGTDYTDMGTMQLLSVPYALYAASAGNNAAGPTGATGPQGSTGAVGATGAQGLQGNTGASGAQGVQGSTGAIGATGPQNAADTIWARNGTNIYNTNTGNVGILTNAPQAALTVNGYTMLGMDAPAVKMKQFTGNTPANAGDSTNINTGIPDSKILSVSVLVQDPVNGLLTPALNLLNVQYTYSIVSSVFSLKTSLLNSLSILNKPYTVLIIYTQ